METTLGEIITFYSYKGGTGRSMALANVACLLAQKQDVGKGVLMIDWDLEAPGLHQFFHGKFENTRDEEGDLPSGQLGLIDLFYEIRNRLVKSKSQENLSEDIFSEIDIQKYIVKVNQSSLFLMPAGKFDDGVYSARVNEFDWADFFSDFPSVITQFAQHLRKKYKYVLIDSRTGYTDISGICTSIMPEKLVAVFTPNRQSLSGIVELIRRATDYRKQSDDLRPLMIFPLPSRIENAENILKKEWRFGNSNHEGYQTQLASVLLDVFGLEECDLTNYFDEYQLQYVPRYSYGEEIAVLSERSEDRLSLARSFENFAERIVNSENPWEETKKMLGGHEAEREISKEEVDEFSKAKTEVRRRTFFRATLTTLGVVGLILLFYFASSSVNNVLLMLVFGLLGLSKRLRHSVIEKIIEAVSLMGKAGDTLKTDFLEQVSHRASLKFDTANLQYSYSNITRGINNIFKASANSLRNHATSVSHVIEPDDNLRSWRMFGYLFQLFFLMVFVYADLTQVINNLTLLFPQDVATVPAWLLNQTLPILISSVGIVVASGFILAEFGGITYFGKWSELKGSFRTVTYALVPQLVKVVG